jgi:hypothetical protein
LRVLTGLRKLQRIYKQKIKAMPIVYDLEYYKDDPFYLEGIEAGEIKGIEKGIELGEGKKAADIAEKMLIDGSLPIKRIAVFIDKTEAFVIAIQQRLIQEGKIIISKKKK